jgi:hypothetical protein
MQYDTMDMDSEVNAALDILVEFCTGKDKENATPFHMFLGRHQRELKQITEGSAAEVDQTATI